MNVILLSAISAIDPKTGANDAGLSDADIAAIRSTCRHQRGAAVNLYDCGRCAHRGACAVAEMATAARAKAQAAKAARRAKAQAAKAARRAN